MCIGTYKLRIVFNAKTNNVQSCFVDSHFSDDEWKLLLALPLFFKKITELESSKRVVTLSVIPGGFTLLK
jgi:hypothetical protein